ncbi:uncharacterized protein LOC114541737 [Dendronephthya gigantea]|uniref:uncharacterized protein LOC114541737 n=1 Tax=Dendronephthya gigantea TaxID=151771 RepID=UPI00106A6773|nr:uncharacterized protein LOC114541737 [Dendronephthya gigantea]
MHKSSYLQKGIEISSSADISVLCLNYDSYYTSYAADGNLALPTKILGSVYVVASYRPYSSSYRANIAVISGHDNNKIFVLSNKNAIVYYRGLWYNGQASKLCITQVLEKLDALYLSGTTDLSGTLVYSSKPVTVISGVESPRIVSFRDFLETNLLPVSLWGYEYLLTPVGTMDKTQGNIFRIFAYENNTSVEGPYWTKVLSSQMYTELLLEKNLASYIKCSKPCQVVQYIRGEEISGKYAEPSMMVLPSVSQFLSYYHVALPFGSEYHDSITIVIQNEDVDGLYMDGVKLIGLRWERISGTNYVWTVASLFDPSSVTVYHASSSVKFGLLVFGWNKLASYAYAGGLDFDNRTNMKAVSSVPSFQSRKNSSNYGTHFIIGFTPHYKTDSNDFIGVSILAVDETNVTIFSNQGSQPWNYTVQIDEGEIFEYKLPIALQLRKSSSLQKGIEISSSGYISVLCLNNDRYYDNYAADGNLALPTNTLGVVYVVASYRPYSSDYRANIAVISAHDNNRIFVLPNKNAVVYYRGLWYNGRTSKPYFTQVLEKLDALYLSGTTDLSGTLVISSKPVTVISGVERPGIAAWRDFFETNLLPVSLWGYEYILTPVGTMDKTQGNIFRIFAYENNTSVQGPYWTKVLSSQMYTELLLEKNLASYIKCSKPCQVVQYIRGEEIGGKNAEPSMMVLPSVGQFLSYYHVALPFGSAYHDSITIIIQNEDVDGLYMNGVKLNGLRWERINGTKYVWTVISLSDPSTVTVYHASSSVKFGLLVFGWDNYASYAYAGGLDLANRSNNVIALSPVPSYQSRIKGVLNNYGKHFIIGFTAQYVSHDQRTGFIGLTIFAPYGANMTILSKHPSASLNFTTNIKLGQTFEYKLPIALRMNGTGKQMKGIEIVSTRNISVSCVNHERRTADAYLALPVSALGLSYVVATYSRGNIGIISAFDDNEITLLLVKDRVLSYNGFSYDESLSLIYAKVVLKKLEALHIYSEADLSGSIIISSKPVSVISGSNIAKPSGSQGGSDILESFLLPTHFWGKRYILSTFGTIEKKKGDIFRIFAHEKNTVVQSAYWTKVLSPGTYTELDLEANPASFVNCDKPCQVVQYIRGELIHGEEADPSMIVLPSVSQFQSYYRVVFPFGSEYHDSVSIVIENEYRKELYVDGMKINSDGWKEINGTKYVWKVLNFADYESVTIYHSSSAVKFGLLAFGWDNRVSYAYPAGVVLSNILNDKTPFLSPVPTYMSRFIGDQNSYGKHFIIGFTSQYQRHQTDYIGVSILALGAADVTIFSNQTGQPWNYTVHINEGGIFDYKLPISLQIHNSTLVQKGIEISSSEDISVLCVNFDGYSKAADANLALATNTLGLVYVVASYRPYSSNYRANIAVISAHDNNTINILLNKNVAVYYRGKWYVARISQIYITEVLEKLEALYLSSKSDLSGTLVIASKPVSVISGVERLGILGWYDFVETTMLPLYLWDIDTY